MYCMKYIAQNYIISIESLMFLQAPKLESLSISKIDETKATIESVRLRL